MKPGGYKLTCHRDGQNRRELQMNSDRRMRHHFRSQRLHDTLLRKRLPRGRKIVERRIEQSLRLSVPVGAVVNDLRHKFATVLEMDQVGAFGLRSAICSDRGHACGPMDGRALPRFSGLWCAWCWPALRGWPSTVGPMRTWTQRILAPKCVRFQRELLSREFVGRIHCRCCGVIPAGCGSIKPLDPSARTF